MVQIKRGFSCPEPTPIGLEVVVLSTSTLHALPPGGGLDTTFNTRRPVIDTTGCDQQVWCQGFDTTADYFHFRNRWRQGSNLQPLALLLFILYLTSYSPHIFLVPFIYPTSTPYTYHPSVFLFLSSPLFRPLLRFYLKVEYNFFFF